MSEKTCLESVQRRHPGPAAGIPMTWDKCGKRAHKLVKTKGHPDGWAMCNRHAKPYENRLLFNPPGEGDAYGIIGVEPL